MLLTSASALIRLEKSARASFAEVSAGFRVQEFTMVAIVEWSTGKVFFGNSLQRTYSPPPDI